MGRKGSFPANLERLFTYRDFMNLKLEIYAHFFEIAAETREPKMGDDLYYTIPKFFEDRMNEHSSVASIKKLNVDGEVIYEIKRNGFFDKVKVWLSDAYLFTEFDFDNRPKEIKAGDYILIAKPEANGGVDAEIIMSSKIGVGKLKEFMGALRVMKMWTYTPPTEEEIKAKKAKYGRNNSRIYRK